MQEHNKPKFKELIGSIDQGTSSTRFLLFERDSCQLVASSQIEVKRIIPKEGWVEMDPMNIIHSVNETIKNVFNQVNNQSDNDTTFNFLNQLKCLGICNQRESTVVWDKITGEPLYNVIVWLDNRTADIVDNMIDSIPGRDFNFLKDKTGLPMSTYFSAFKLKWLIDNVSQVQQALREDRLMFGTVDTWILWNLTGEHLTDVTNASRTFLMNIETLEWDSSLCKLFGIPSSILPRILSSADDFGFVQQGPLVGIPVTGVIGDQSAALFGHNCLQLGQTKATFGTGAFIMQNIGPGPLNGALKGVSREARRGLITTVGYKLKNKPVCYALEGSVKIAGAALTWLRDNLQLISDYSECDQLIDKTTNSAGVFFVPALGGLYSPYWDPNASGLFIGLSQFTRREHLVRATFDSIAFQTNDILKLMRGITSGLMIDGGLCNSDNMCQILADITGCEIVRPSMTETSALGAAMVAGFGALLWLDEKILMNYSVPCTHHHYPDKSLYQEEKFSLGPTTFRHSLKVNPELQGDGESDVTTNLLSQQNKSHVDCSQSTVNHIEPTEEQASSAGGRESSSALSTTSETDEDSTEEVEREVRYLSAQSNNSLLNSQMNQVDMYYSQAPSSGYHSVENYDAASLSRRDTPTSSQVASKTVEGFEIDKDLKDFSGTSNVGIEATNQSDNIVCDESRANSLFIGSTPQQLQQSILTSAKKPQCYDSDMTQAFVSTDNQQDATLSQANSAVIETMNITTTNKNKSLSNISNNNKKSICTTNNKNYNDVIENESVDNNTYVTAQNGNKYSQISLIVDIFQSYISEEHRIELVKTWGLAVDRSMNWTQVDHEVIRRSDYGRMSAVPLQIYIFFSFCTYALSEFVSAVNLQDLR